MLPFARALVRAVAIALLVLVCLPPHGIARARGIASPWPRRFLAGAARIAGARVQIDGTMLRRDVLLVANHVSWLDILVLGGATGCAFVSKDDVGRWPVFGWLAAQNHTILVQRADRAGVAMQVGMVSDRLATGTPVALFPEGTTGDGRILLPFKPALLAVASAAPFGLRVQPVGIDYGAAATDIAWTGAEGALSNVRRLLGRGTPIEVMLRFLDPVDPALCADRKALAAETRGRIAAAMPALRGHGAPV